MFTEYSIICLSLNFIRLVKMKVIILSYSDPLNRAARILHCDISAVDQ